MTCLDRKRVPHDELGYSSVSRTSAKSLYLLALKSRWVHTENQTFKQLVLDTDKSYVVPRVSPRAIGFSVEVVGFGAQTAPETFVNHAERLARRGNIDAAIDLIYDRADEMLLAGQFDQLNDILYLAQPGRLSVDVLLGVLTITLSARSKLPARAHFYREAEQTLRARNEYTDSLLTGLR